MDLSHLFNNFPPELATFIISMLPISELRGAIPVAIGVYHLNPIEAYFLAVIGNIIPVVFILKYLEPVSEYLMAKSKFSNKFFTYLFEHTRRKHNGKFEKWGALALITFVAIPLPVTGGWSGALAAFVFGIPFKKALPLIFLGVMIAGVIVTGLSLGVFNTIW
ncbi:MAG: small multi-drug export protein [Candidatus Andersenbacteria bacterium]|nr:small multi-drug export protein [Candidatus Andersenbacteria bacterium]